MQEVFDVVADDIDFPSNRLGIAWIQSSDTKIGMQAASNTLKQLLVGIKGDSENPLFIATETTDEPIAWNNLAQWTRVHIRSGNAFGTPDLAGNRWR
jgi:hypothetical protein